MKQLSYLRRSLSFCLLLALLLALVPAPRALAAPTSGTCGAEGDNLRWSFAEGILSLSGSGAMANYSFDEPAPWSTYRSKIIQVCFEDGITSIGDLAFSYCEKVTSITLPDSLNEIGINPFWGCKSLLTIRVSSNHTALAVIEGVLFSKADRCLVCYPNAKKDTDYSVPEGILRIGDGAFYGCRYLKSVSLPDGLVNIGRKAFQYCGLTSILLPDGIECFGEEAFSFCDVQSITLPIGLTTIPDKAFYGCRSLTNIFFSDGITAIGNEAFSHCKIKSIVLPEGLITLGEKAFSFCEGLETVSFPKSLTKIGSNPFYDCISLTSFFVSSENLALAVVDEALVSYAEGRLVCYPLRISGRAYTLPEGIYGVDDGAFMATKLESIELKEGLISIGESSFSLCTSLNSISIPESVSKIGTDAFAFDYRIIITVHEGSYAEQYCIDNNLNYQYPVNLDWLKD